MLALRTWLFHIDSNSNLSISFDVLTELCGSAESTVSKVLPCLSNLRRKLRFRSTAGETAGVRGRAASSTTICLSSLGHRSCYGVFPGQIWRSCSPSSPGPNQGDRRGTHCCRMCTHGCHFSVHTANIFSRFWRLLCPLEFQFQLSKFTCGPTQEQSQPTVNLEVGNSSNGSIGLDVSTELRSSKVFPSLSTLRRKLRFKSTIDEIVGVGGKPPPPPCLPSLSHHSRSGASPPSPLSVGSHFSSICLCVLKGLCGSASTISDVVFLAETSMVGSYGSRCHHARR